MEDGTQFFFKGIAYQQGIGEAGKTSSSNTDFSDPLADAEKCKRDVPILKSLDTNVIRTYAIDPTADHSECMSLLQDAGIYVVSDLGQPKLSINRNTPKWDVELFTRYKGVVDNLSKYSNVIGFFAGNEVSNSLNTTNASAFVKAAVRDTKKYIKDKGYKKSVGYAADDDAKVRDNIIKYFNCGPTEESIDFFGYNVYEWCGHSSFAESGYNRILDTFKDYSVPVFFAEYGCNKNGGAKARLFEETPALYVQNMSETLSGGIVYEYFQEENDFGLVKESGNSVSKLADFATLQKQIKNVDPKGVTMSKYTPSNKAQSCPTLDDQWASSTDLPPTPNADACSCMAKAVSCAVRDSTDKEDYGKIFGYICGRPGNLCAEITANSTSGKYGAYSGCAAKDQLSYVLDAYYKSQNNAADACSFKGMAGTQSASGSLSSCKKVVDSGSSGNGSDTENAAPGSARAGALWGASLVAGLIGAGVMAL